MLEIYGQISGDRSLIDGQLSLNMLGGVRVEEAIMTKEEIDYDKVGFYVGDSIARLIL